MKFGIKLVANRENSYRTEKFRSHVEHYNIYV